MVRLNARGVLKEEKDYSIELLSYYRLTIESNEVISEVVCGKLDACP